jgi:hypothetical protein
MPKQQQAEESVGKKWGLDKRVGPATFINFTQLVAVIWFGSAFYTQVNADRTRTDERFQSFTEARKAQDDHIDKMQTIQESMLLSMTKMGDQQEATTEALRDIRELLRKSK